MTYYDSAHGQWVGEREYRDPEDPATLRRQTEWFPTEEEAAAFEASGGAR